MSASAHQVFRGLLLDADNTLLDFDRAEREALRDALRRLRCPAALDKLYEQFHRINAGLWRRFERGELGLEELRVERFRALFAEAGVAADPREGSAHYLEALAGKDFLLPHARRVLRRLSGRVGLVLLSNGLSQVQRGRLRRAGITGCFRHILISEEVGLAKPDARIFRLAVERLGLPPPEVLCVGDNPATDIRGAHGAGLASCWCHRRGEEYPTGEPLPDYRIEDLRELWALV